MKFNEEKKKALLKIFQADFDKCRLVIYDLLPHALEDGEHYYAGDTNLDFIKENIKQISIIKRNVDDLEDWELDDDYQIDRLYFKKLDHQIFVDALVEVYDIDKSVAEALCIDLYGKLWETPKNNK